MVFIYWLENHPAYANRVEHIKRQMEARQDRLFTSTLAAAEVMTGPKKARDLQTVSSVEAYFRSSDLSVLPFEFAEGLHYSDIRAQYRAVTAPDAVHLACAAAEGIDVFITNDKNLIGKKVPGIQFIVGLDTNLF